MDSDNSTKPVSIYHNQNREYYLNHKAEIQKNAIARHAVNKEKDNEYGRKWRKENQDKVRKHYLLSLPKKLAQLKEWRKHNPEKVKEHARRSNLKNAEAISKHQKQYHKKRYATDPEYKARFFHQAAQRRTTIQQRTTNPQPILDFVESVKSKPSAVCYYCQKRVSTNHIHFDHMIPLSKGGMHSVENLCVSCDKCNLSKHDKLIADWMTLGQQLLTL